MPAGHASATGPYPALAAADLDMDLESVFEFCLGRMLDGYAALIEPAGGSLLCAWRVRDLCGGLRTLAMISVARRGGP